jgi:hypothetical protein
MSVITRTAPKSPPTSIELVAWPLRDRPGRAWTTIGVLSLVAIAVRWITGSWLLALLASGATSLTVWRIFVPQRFEFSPQGITQQVWRRKRRIAWTAIGRWEPRADGLYLLPATAEAPIDALYGLYIPLGERRDEVLALVERYTARPAQGENSATRRSLQPNSSPPLGANDEERSA